jgi:hypothetical protein
VYNSLLEGALPRHNDACLQAILTAYDTHNPGRFMP